MDIRQIGEFTHTNDKPWLVYGLSGFVIPHMLVALLIVLGFIDYPSMALSNGFGRSMGWILVPLLATCWLAYCADRWIQTLRMRECRYFAYLSGLPLVAVAVARLSSATDDISRTAMTRYLDRKYSRWLTPRAR